MRDEILQYGIYWEAAKKSALLSGKIDQYEYHKGEQVLSSDQGRIIDQAKTKKTKNNWRRRTKKTFNKF